MSEYILRMQIGICALDFFYSFYLSFVVVSLYFVVCLFFVVVVVFCLCGTEVYY